MPQEKSTPLQLAAEMGHAAIEEALLAAGADKDAKGQVRRGKGAGRVGGDSVWLLLVSFLSN